MAEDRGWWEELAAPFPPDRVKWRIGSTNAQKTRGMALAYIDARDVMERLDQVVGPGNWMSEMTMCPDGRTSCTISVRVLVTDPVQEMWIKRTDIAGATDFEGAKGGASDAFKRAAVHLGVGRYLYHLDSPWVEIESRGKATFLTEAAKQQLHAMLGGKGAPPSSKAGEAERPASPSPSQPENEPARLVTKEDVKPLWRANFKALEAVGHSKAQVDAMENKDKYAPINYATSLVGVRRVDELYVDQIEPCLEHMRCWVRDQRASTGKENPPDEPGPVSSDDPGYEDERWDL